MLHEVDDALARLLKRDLERGTEVSFAAPTASWPEVQRKRPMLDVHLFEVREETSMRSSGLERALPADDGDPIMRRPGPRWFRLSYWLSAWGGAAAAGHRVLGASLAALVRDEALPGDVLNCDLARLGLPVRMAVAMPPAGDAHVATVWSSLGVPLRAALELQVVAPLEVPAGVEAGPPVIERRLRIGPPMQPPPPAKQAPPGVPPALMSAAGAPPGAPPAHREATPAPAATPAAPAAAPVATELPGPPLEELLISPDPREPPRVLDPDAGNPKSGAKEGAAEKTAPPEK